MLFHDLTTAPAKWFQDAEHKYLPRLTEARIAGYELTDPVRPWPMQAILALIVGDFGELVTRGFFRRVQLPPEAPKRRRVLSPWI